MAGLGLDDGARGALDTRLTRRCPDRKGRARPRSTLVVAGAGQGVGVRVVRRRSGHGTQERVTR